MRFKYFIVGLFAFFALGAALNASAATLSLTPKGQNFGVGQEFTVDLIVNTEDANINAAQVVINFPAEVLQAVSVDRSKSVFNFWVEDPTIANGQISFIGGTSEILSGSSLLIFSIKFKAVGAGKADITLSDGIVTAADGKGTNVLSIVKGANISVSPAVAAPETAPVVQEQPKPIAREPVPAAKLPSQPKITVGLYPDPDKWYNKIGDVIALWDVPDDIIQVAAIVDQAPKTAPAKFDKELFNGKNFGPFKEGIWYLHIRFRNNVGAGPTAHYRIAIDATPPLPFGIESSEGLKISGLGQEELRTDNPQPTFKFSTNDSLSGISRYIIEIEGQEVIEASKGELKLPLQPPGRRTVAVRAIDNAGNIQEQTMNMEILPIESPNITFVNKDALAGEGNLLIKGTAKKDFTVKVFVRSRAGDLAVEGAASVNEGGGWEILLDAPLKRGHYQIEIVAQDQRGALSLPVKSEPFKIRERPLFTIGGFGITQFWFFAGLMLVLLAGILGGWFFYHLWRVQLGRKVVVAQRDVTTAFNVIGKDIEKALSSYSDKKVDKREVSEIEFLLKKIKENSEKMKKYVTENIEDIPK